MTHTLIFKFYFKIESEYYMIKFYEIPEKTIAIRFYNEEQFDQLMDYFKTYGYQFGIGNSSFQEMKQNWYSFSNQEENHWISLDSSKSYCKENYISYGKGFKYTLYDFNEINFSYDKEFQWSHFTYKGIHLSYEDMQIISDHFESIKKMKETTTENEQER